MLDEAFKDIHEMSRSCRFKDCQHMTEPGCEVRKAVEDGRIAPSRFENYLKMRREVQHLSLRSDGNARAAEKARWRSLMKDLKHYQRFKKEGK